MCICAMCIRFGRYKLMYLCDVYVYRVVYLCDVAGAGERDAECTLRTCKPTCLPPSAQVAELCVTNKRNQDDDEMPHVGQHLVMCLCDIQSGHFLDENTRDVVHKNEAKDFTRCRAYLAHVVQRTGHSVHTNYDDVLTALLTLCKKIKKKKKIL